jgi:aryl-alcohol dehydrogenase-like predicted oxidoreductase
MEHRPLGRTGVSVSKFCLGAMMFGSWGNNDHDQSIRIIHRALDAGINFIDTADVYAQGESEQILGKALTGGWLSGRWRKDTGQQSSSRANRLPERFDLSLPANQRKLDAVEELAQLAEAAGITLIQLAIAFVLSHPAITAALIGPRTMDQLESQLVGADVVLDAAVLDRIDETVPPGTTINPADNSWANPALQPAARRR